jgi:2,4-diketo-3-deoxy-L-fuconate hydrolase
MKLARFGIPGSEKPALIDTQGRLRDLSEHLADITAESLSDERLEKVAAIDIDQLPVVDNHVRIGPPVADVRRIICIGLNYKDQATETGDSRRGLDHLRRDRHRSECPCLQF